MPSSGTEAHLVRFLSFLILAGLLACSEQHPQTPPLDQGAETRRAYAFFSAGHIYGHPYVDDVSVHPPFREKYELVTTYPNMAFGFFTGDMVYRGDIVEEWDALDAFIGTLEMPIFMAVGNHELYHPGREIFNERYGPTYFFFTHENDLFLVLDGNLDNWSISGAQLTFLNQTLDQHPRVDHIFVFTHQVLWWAPDNHFAGVRINSSAGRGEEVNFWTEVEPRLRNHGAPVYLFAGDVGAFAIGHEFHYYSDDGIHYIASGMGGGERDNLVVVEVGADKQVHLRLLALNGPDPDALGDLESSLLPPPPAVGPGRWATESFSQPGSPRNSWSATEPRKAPRPSLTSQPDGRP